MQAEKTSVKVSDRIDPSVNLTVMNPIPVEPVAIPNRRTLRAVKSIIRGKKSHHKSGTNPTKKYAKKR